MTKDKRIYIGKSGDKRPYGYIRYEAANGLSSGIAWIACCLALFQMENNTPLFHDKRQACALQSADEDALCIQPAFKGEAVTSI